MKHLASLVTGAALFATTATSVLAQDITWRFNNNYAPTRPESAHIRNLAENVAEFSGGSFTINVIEGGGMNLQDADALRWMQTGTPEIAFIWPTFIGRDAPDLANLYVYGSVSTAQEHLRALPAVQDALTEGFAQRNIPVVGFMALPIIDASLFCREPVRNLEELRRVRLRVGSREQVETFSALGVAAQIIPQNELYSALQTGVVDCALYAARFARSVSLQEVARHAVYTGFPFPPAPYAIVAHSRSLEALSEDHRQALDRALDVLAEESFQFDDDAAAEVAAREDLTEAGVTWYDDFNAEDQDAIREAAAQTWLTLSEEGGEAAVGYRAQILDLLGD
ncbi:TRAP transporter substrate-binding protein DctP [Roseinatronobacter sp. S2]|uniref:TRAP transporter substrate-binding protein DctP n=1 Tax=Roseinatronobacter sp. S2 TaxID=3035471 RepID=UPI0024104952|nr:TRAP transporter substrate-binding protein DctP [Roseinatronobacter sp. S2]WFE76487.1 TRAP transporter substrate-binding protein DctP [Roseinatronobacter sp. S2]